MGDYVIIVEIDENQHKGYDFSCENKRLMILSQDVGHRNIVFIRFNPDKYHVDGMLISSCWKANGFGILTVPKEKRKDLARRLETLKSTIDHWWFNPPSKMIEVVHLFYDHVAVADVGGVGGESHGGAVVC